MSSIPADHLEPCFIDTNIWLYAFVESDKLEKSIRAKELIRACQPVISVQVINEVCINLIKKASFKEEQIQALIQSFYEKYTVIELDKKILLSASNLRMSYALSFWDSLIIASALQSNVYKVYTEDIQHMQVIEQKLLIINPFA